MTPEQLKKLAEIAGISPLDEIEVLGRTAIYAWVPTPFNQFVRTEWMPHVKIEHAIMVADKAFEFWQLSRGKVIGRFRCTGVYKSKEHGALESRSDWLSTPAEAICAAALAIGG